MKHTFPVAPGGRGGQIHDPRAMNFTMLRVQSSARFGGKFLAVGWQLHDFDFFPILIIDVHVCDCHVDFTTK